MKLERLITNKVDVEEEKKQIVKGVDVTLIPTQNAYKFGLQLLDHFFTKEELGSSIAFQTTRSEKTLLNQEKMRHLIELMERRCPEKDWDINTFAMKANQKCRDTRFRH